MDSKSFLSCCLSRKNEDRNTKQTTELNPELHQEKLQKRNQDSPDQNQQGSGSKQRTSANRPRDSENMAGRLTATQLEFADDLLNKEGIEGIVEDLKTPIYTHAQWTKILKNNDLENTSMTEVVHSLRHGVKEELRPMIWDFLTNIENLKSQHPADHYKTLKGKPSKQDENIKKDAAQTFPDHRYFSDEGSKAETLLFNILRAYANHDTEIGYVQGMNFIVGKMLIILDPENFSDSDSKYFQKYDENFEEKIFWLLVHINYTQNWRQVYNSNIPKIQGLLVAFESRLKLKVPEIYNTIKSSKVDMTKCFQSLFVSLCMNSAPISIAKRLFDLFFIEEEQVLFRVLIRIITLCKPEIIEASKDGNLEEFLKNELLEVCGHKYRTNLYIIFPTEYSD